MRVRRAVIPAAGLGTRFLPATKAQPKEMIPVIDKPGIQYAVEEAVRCGIVDVLIVTAPDKGSIADHFGRSLQLEAHLDAVGKSEELSLVRSVAEMADVSFVTQAEPLGFGHAVSLAASHVGDEPFVVMVPDEIVPDPIDEEREPLQRMLDIYEERSASVIVVQEVPRSEISSYGAIEPGRSHPPDVVEVRGIVEKPPVAEAPSNLAARGRYIFAPRIFEELTQTSSGIGGEIQLTDAIDRLARSDRCFAYVHSGPILDVGKKLDYLRASVELALRRDDLGKPFKDYLIERARTLGA